MQYVLNIGGRTCSFLCGSQTKHFLLQYFFSQGLVNAVAEVETGYFHLVPSLLWHNCTNCLSPSDILQTHGGGGSWHKMRS